MSINVRELLFWLAENREQLAELIKEKSKTRTKNNTEIIDPKLLKAYRLAKDVASNSEAFDSIEDYSENIDSICNFLIQVVDIGFSNFQKKNMYQEYFEKLGNYDTAEVISELLKDKRVNILDPNHSIEIDGKDFRLIHDPEDGIKNKDSNYF